MGKTYNGGNVVISPTTTPGWFGNGEPERGSPGPALKPVELSPEAEQQIAELRRSIAALKNNIAAPQRDLSSEKQKLVQLLTAHSQPVESELLEGETGI